MNYADPQPVRTWDGDKALIRELVEALKDFWEDTGDPTNKAFPHARAIRARLALAHAKEAGYE